MRKYIFRICISCALGILCCVVSAPRVVAQEPKIDDLAKKLAKQISKAKIKSVVLENFTAPDGFPSPQGKLLTALFFNEWTSHQESFSVLPPDKMEEFLAQHKLVAKDLDSLEKLQQLSRGLNVEAVVRGNLVPGPSQVALNILVRRIQDGESLATASRTFPRSGIFAGLDAPSSANSPTNTLRAGVNGVGTPVCIYCPPGSPSTLALANKVHAAVLLDALVTTHGRAEDIVILKNPGYGLEEKAIEAVKSWRFRPARDAAGNPAAVRTQIEITFNVD